MSANPNPRVHVLDDGVGIDVEVDGVAVGHVTYGTVGRDVTVDKAVAESLTGVLANVITKSLPPEPVHIAMRATVVAHVTPQGVTEVHILPDQEDISVVFDANGNDDATVDAAIKWVNDNTWLPLLDLPASVVWEG